MNYHLLIFCFLLLPIDAANAQNGTSGFEAVIEFIRIPVTEIDPGSLGERSEMNSWRKLSLPRTRSTEYTVGKDNDRNFIMAESNDQASGFYYSLNVDPEEYPIMEWSWKVQNVISVGDMKSKSGDDYAARVYLTFEYDKKDLPLGERIKYGAIRTFTSYEIPLRSLNYVWSNKYERGSITQSPYTSWVYMIAAETGSERAGKWVTTSINLLEDFKQAFGEIPGKITGIAIMSDTDNTGASTKAWYGDIFLKKE